MKTNETEEALKRAVGTSRYERDFSVGYSHTEYKRLTEKYREPVKPIVFRKENKDKIQITFSDFKNHTAGYYRGYTCVQYNNLGLGARGETIVVTKQQLLEGLGKNLKSYLEFVEPFLATVPWRIEEKAKKLKQYEIDTMLIMNY